MPKLQDTFASFMVVYFLVNNIHVAVYHGIDNSRIKNVCNDECVQTTTDPKFNICLYEISEDIHVSSSIRLYGHWANDLTLKIHAALTFYPNATFIDIGANIGYFTLYSCTLSKHVVAIEAVSRNTQMVYKGLALNRCKGNVIVLNNAISNARTIVHMSENRYKNMGGLAVYKEELTAHAESSPNNLSWIEAITMDDILPYVATTDVVIKIDIEGYECKALESSTQFFKVKTVYYIFMEWLVVGERLRKSSTACPLAAAHKMVASLAAMGFIPFEYSPKQRILDVNKISSWTAYDILWQHKASLPV
ncbi:hypothetical protein ACJMK2_006395 [Sinanodonta woodiana]|uniref:Methyltransferase FkbM domain-containing protein n=1 Tax=Sinanodonta woodiana TaxID=1069815 RepID=A0ABD3VUN1_SINWO